MDDLRAFSPRWTIPHGILRAPDGAGGFAPGAAPEGSVHGAAIADGGVGLAKLADLPAGTLLGRAPGADGPPQALTAAQATAMLATPFVYPTLADLQAADHPETAPGTLVRVLERAEGAGGGAHWRVVDQAPAHPLWVTSNGGAVIWEIAEEVLTPQMAGAVGDGVTDDGWALQDMIDCLASRGGGEALFTRFHACAQRLDVTGHDIKLRGLGPMTSGVLFTAKDARFHCGASGWRFIVEDMLVSGEYVADYCFYHEGNNANPEIRGCRVEKAEKACVFYDWETTAWKIVNSNIALAGARDASGILTPGAHAVHARCIGEITGGSILASATGHLLFVEGSQYQEEVRVNVVGGRLNSGYEGLLKVVATPDPDPAPPGTTAIEGQVIPWRGMGHNRGVTVNLLGTYLENPGEVSFSGASGEPEASVHAIGEGARVNIEAPLKHLIRKAKCAYLAEDGAQIHVRSRGFMARAQLLGGSPRAAFARARRSGSDTPGRIVLGDLPTFWDENGLESMSEWLSLIECEGAPAGLAVSPERLRKVAVAMDGGSTAGMTVSAGTVSVDADPANRLTGAGSIRLEGGGQSAATSFRLDWTVPAHLEGHALMALAIARFGQTGADWGGALGAPTPRFRVEDPAGQQSGAGIFPWWAATLPAPVPAPGQGAQSGWWWFPVFFKVQTAGTVRLVFNLDTQSQALDDVAWVDSVSVFEIEGRLPDLF